MKSGTIAVLAVATLAATACEEPTDPDPVDDAPAVLDLTVTDNLHNVLSVRVEVVARGYDSAFVRYWRTGVEAERTPTYALADFEPRTIPVLGLRAQTEYMVETVLVHAGSATPVDTAGVATGILPDWVPEISTQGDMPAPGYVALSMPDGPVIIDNAGTVVWYRHFPNGVLNSFQAHPNDHYTVLGVTDTAVQRIHVMDVLGDVVGGVGCVGFDTRFHEVRVMATGDAWVMCNDTRVMDLSAEGGSDQAEVTATVVQHVSADGALLFEWNAFDHFAISDLPPAELAGSGVNFTHGNSIEFDTDGHLLLSFRSLNEITKVHRETGEVIWRFGGRRSDFTIDRDAKGTFERQHGVRLAGPGQIQILDNGFDPPSRFVRYLVDPLNDRAVLVAEYLEPDSAFTMVGGSTDYDPSTGRALVSFGRAGRVVELDPAGNPVWRVIGLEGMYVFRAQRIGSLYQPGTRGW